MIKRTVLAALLLLSTTVPAVAADAPKSGFPILAFTKEMKTAIESSANWTYCGDYFAQAETTGGKIVTFAYKEVLSPVFPVVALYWIFAPPTRIQTAINDKVQTPSVDVMGSGDRETFILKMSYADYKAGLPCLATGKTI